MTRKGSGSGNKGSGGGVRGGEGGVKGSSGVDEGSGNIHRGSGGGKRYLMRLDECCHTVTTHKVVAVLTKEIAVLLTGKTTTCNEVRMSDGEMISTA